MKQGEVEAAERRALNKFDEWVAFVMKEKYNKVWTDTDWQPAGEG
jgi:hypothetical protein